MDFQKIVEKYSSRIYYVVRRIVRDHDDADDVLQNTFMKAWQARDSFRGEAGVYTWLYRIAVNEALAFLRNSSKMQYASGEEAERELRNLYDNDPYFDGDKAQKALAMAVDTLPAKQKAVFTLRYFEELSYAQISEVMETSQGALKASYHHAQKKVEEQLNLFIENISN
ncbi:MAG: RNA polymerase sigma factor [Rikenellaceae bacterium]